MVLRRGIAVLCLAAVVAMGEVSFVEASSHLQEKSASDHHHHHHHRHHRSVDHVKDSKDDEDVVKTYEHGNVRVSSKKHAEKDAKHSHHKSKKTHKKKQAEEEKSKKVAKKDNHKKTHHRKKVQESVTEDGEIVRKYEHGNVRIVKKKVSPTLIERHNKSKKAKKAKEEKASKKNKKAHEAVDNDPSDEIVDFEGDIPDGGELEIETYGDGEVEVNVDGTPLGINVHDGVVDITYKGKKTTYQGDVVADIELDDSETAPEGSSSGKPEEEWAEFDSEESDASGWVEFDDSGSDDFFEVGSESASGSGSDVGFIEVAEEELNEAVEKISELATEFAAEGNNLINHYGPVVVICGIFGALAAIIGIAAVAVNRARSHMTEDGGVASVLSDGSDVEAGVLSEETTDAAAADNDSLDDSESDEDEDEEGSFTNDGHVSV